MPVGNITAIKQVYYPVPFAYVTNTAADISMTFIRISKTIARTK